MINLGQLAVLQLSSQVYIHWLPFKSKHLLYGMFRVSLYKLNCVDKRLYYADTSHFKNYTGNYMGSR